MRQFLYLDTDIVNSIIAQQDKGLIDEITTEKEQGTDKNRTMSAGIEGAGETGLSFLKLANVETKFNINGSIEGASSKHDTAKEIVAKTLHDAAFDIAYNAIKPVVLELGKGDPDPGEYTEMCRVFDFVDLNYLDGLFSKEGGVVNLLNKKEKEKIKRDADEIKKSSLNREQRRHEGKKIVEQNVNELLKQCDKRYDEIHEIIVALGRIIPFKRMLVSSDGYLIPTEDKFFRINPATLGFMYGGEIKCVGMVTNIIGKDTDPEDKKNIFATLQFSVNEVLRQMLPTKEENIIVITPIAIFYEN